MTKWEYDAFEIKVTGGIAPDSTVIWKKKNKDGSTDWHKIEKAGLAGWELVNTIPIADSRGSTEKLLVIFKRPL
jgi:hypothetical protein